jgi:phosphatidylglycerol:prolipoprotein diacylglycerol transferase
MLLFAFIAGIVGARLGHAIRYLDLYLGDPIAFVSLSPVTLSIPEGLLAAILVAIIYGNRKQLRFWATMDVLTPGMALFMVFLGLAHLSSGDAFGSQTSVPWAIDLWGAKRHPSQFYETISALIIFSIIMLVRTRSFYKGFLFLLFLGLTAASRVFLEAWRGDSVIILGMLRQSQVVGLGALVLVLVTMHFLSRLGAPAEDRA